MYSDYNGPTEPMRPVAPAPGPRRGGRAALAGALLLGAIGGGAAGAIAGHATAPVATRTIIEKQVTTGTAASPADTTAQPPLRLVSTSDQAMQVVKRVSPAVVTVRTSGTDPQTGQDFQASGSGVIIDKNGDILTNNHVVANGTSFQVVFESGQKVTARLVDTAPYADLAVLHVDAKVPGWAELGDSSKVQPGQTVLAIGSPLGTFQNTVTEGIISAVGRSITEQNNTTLNGVLQTDAAINHGNSGGPLVDLNGRVIGINTAVVRSSSDTSQDPFGGLLDPFGGSSQSDQAQGLGFAIPSNTARAIVNRILLHLPPGYLGVLTGQAIDPQTASLYNLPVGVPVTKVEPGTPAEKAGIRAKDIITAVDGQQIDQNHNLSTLIEMHQPGQTVKITVFRAGQTLTFNVKLAARPKNLQ